VQLSNSIPMNTPPMGWNSWDCYGASVTEAEVKSNADYMARNLASHGWRYVVVDIQWYEPAANGSQYRKFADLCMDAYGRLIPAESRFPSAVDGKGFKPLADYVHGLGLLFGIHIMRGIPRQAVHDNTPILNSSNTAREIAHPYSICPWNTDMYGIQQSRPGAQAYYDSILQLYAEWEVDFLKVDDISFTEFGADSYAGKAEIEMIHSAITRCGRPIQLSLSCGPTPVEHASHLCRHANMWRITADLWDRWEDVCDVFHKCALWAPYIGDNHWPDADMLPLGHLSIRGSEHGVGERYSRLTFEEQRSMITLWCMARSPLFFGGNLSDCDSATLALVTNDEVLAINQRGSSPQPMPKLSNDPRVVVWTSKLDDKLCVAVFNLDNIPVDVEMDIQTIGLGDRCELRDLWAHTELGCYENRFVVHMETHGCRLLQLQTNNG